MAKNGTLTVKVLGDAHDFESKMGGLGKTAGLAFAAVGTAAVAGAAKSIAAFTEFQGSMNEVFTLLPGISKDAMDDMSGQVKDFSKEFGVLPDEVVPALYQSLSAGVPKDNVFEFLETAQMAAKGGVTELTTAVDGISSVVNAYGSEVVSAAEASDLMFTAVRLGKTNFEELSASLSNVTPIASGLGVKFEDVSAALAAMTAKGTPTAQATTQLRSLFVELSKAGGDTAKVFEETAGKSFQEFIAAGGDTAEALAVMQKAADKSDVQLQDLFGSVEAGAAALSLASGDTFTNNIEEMGNAAGATEDAFDQMMTGLGPIFDKVKAHIAVFLIDVGEKLAPLVEKAMERAGRAFEILSDWWNENRPTIMRHVEAIRVVMEQFINRVARFLTERLIPNLVKLGRWIVENKPILVGLGVVIGGALVASFVAWAAAATAAAAATFAAAAPVYAIGAAVGLVAAALIYAYKEWDTFRNVVDAVASFLTDTAWPAIKAFGFAIIVAFKLVAGWVADNWPKIQDVIEAVADFLVDDVWPKIRAFGFAIISGFLLVKEWVDENWPKMQAVIDGVAIYLETSVLPKIRNFANLAKIALASVVIQVAKDWSKISDEVGLVADFLENVAAHQIERFTEAVKVAFSGMWVLAVFAINSIGNAVEILIGQLQRLLDLLDGVKNLAGGLGGLGPLSGIRDIFGGGGAGDIVNKGLDDVIGALIGAGVGGAIDGQGHAGGVVPGFSEKLIRVEGGEVIIPRRSGGTSFGLNPLPRGASATGPSAVMSALLLELRGLRRDMQNQAVNLDGHRVGTMSRQESHMHALRNAG